MNFSPLKGTRDFYPDFQRTLDYFFNNWTKVSHRYGFEKYDAPLFESLELYQKKSGDEIESQLYSFEDKGGRKIALKPEITPSLARMVVANANALQKPVRWFSIPRLNRYEKPQKGRLREFFQFNIDIVGEKSILVDFDIVACAIDSLRIFGLTENDFELKFNNRRVIENILVELGFKSEEISTIYKNLDKLGKVPNEVLWENLSNDLNREDIADLQSLFQVKSIEDLVGYCAKRSVSENAYADLIEFRDFIGKTPYAKFIKFEISIVRGLAYYTDLVFEVFAKNSNLRAVAGGGRYDSLLANLTEGKVDLPAIGCGIGDAVLYELLSEKNLLPKLQREIDFYGIYFDETPSAYFLDFVSSLREAGYNVIYSLKSEKVAKQFKNLAKYNPKFALTIGGDEEENRVAKVKNLETGIEKSLSLDEILNNENWNNF